MLSTQELVFFEWYRSLNTLERLAVNCWLRTGDNRLILFLRDSSERLKRFDYETLPDSYKEFTLHRA
jgi:hypothetical protein